MAEYLTNLRHSELTRYLCRAENTSIFTKFPLLQKKVQMPMPWPPRRESVTRCNVMESSELLPVGVRREGRVRTYWCTAPTAARAATAAGVATAARARASTRVRVRDCRPWPCAGRASSRVRDCGSCLFLLALCRNCWCWGLRQNNNSGIWRLGFHVYCHG